MRSISPIPNQRLFALFPRFGPLTPILFALMLASASFAVQAQENPDPDPDPNPNPNVPKEEPVTPVTMTASVSPTAIAAYTGTATLSWRATNAHSCEYDDVTRSVSGSVTVGPYASSGTKSLVVTCTGDGEGNFLESTVSLTVNQAPAPVIATTLSADVLEAGVDSLVVTWSTQYTDYCSANGNDNYPTGGTANLGTYAVGSHSLSFSCTGDGGTTPHTISWKALDPVTVDASVSASTIKANNSDTVTVSWTSENADSCDLGDTDDDEDYGPYSYSEAGAKSATVTCENDLGSASDTANWTVTALDPTVDSITLSDYTITENSDTVDLSWTSSNTDSCSYGGKTDYDPDDEATGLGPYSAGTYTFTVSCMGTAGTASDSATLTVEAEEPPEPDPPEVNVSLSPTTIVADTGTSTLSWTSDHTTSCTRDGNTVATNNTTGVAVGPYSAGAYTFTVECTGPGGTEDDSATLTVVMVDAPDAPETLTATPNPSTDGNTTLSWDAPSSGTAASGYLAYLQGSSSALSKTFEDRTLSLSGLADGTHIYEVKACAGTETAPNCGAAATVTVTVNFPDTDGDGIKDPEDTDDDGDGMPDVWENANGLNPLADDSGGDPDGDGDSNLIEYGNGTDPQTHEQAQLIGFRLTADTIYSNGSAGFDWESRYATSCHFAGDDADVDLGTTGPLTSAPGDFEAGVWNIAMFCNGTGGASPQQTVTLTVVAWVDTDGDGIHDDEDDTPGTDVNAFTSNHRLFTVTTSIPNPDGDETVPLHHLLVKKTGGASGVADFAMRETLGYESFSLSSLDAAWLTPAGEETPFAKDPVLGDYNHDGYDDLAVVDLSDTSFPGLDRIVFAPAGLSNQAPSHAAALDGDARDFFGSLAEWIASPAEFSEDFDVTIGAEEGTQARNSATDAANSKPSLNLNVTSHRFVEPESDAVYDDPNAPPPTAAYPSECLQSSKYCRFIFVPTTAKSIRMELSAGNFPGTVQFSATNPNGASGTRSTDAVVLFINVPASFSGWGMILLAFDWTWGGGGADAVSSGKRDAALLWETVLRPLGDHWKV